MEGDGRAGVPRLRTIGNVRRARAEDRALRFGLRGNGKARVLGETNGFAKTVFDAGTGRLLGLHLIGFGASELIQGFVIARTLGAPAEQFQRNAIPSPTLSEAMHEAVPAAGRRAIHA